MQRFQTDMRGARRPSPIAALRMHWYRWRARELLRQARIANRPTRGCGCGAICQLTYNAPLRRYEGVCEACQGIVRWRPPADFPTKGDPTQ